LTSELLDRHYAVNLRATALLSVEFARRFSGKGGGRIIQLTSGQSLGPMPGELAYAATKGAVEALTKTLAVELAPRGITVNAVNPGPTDTGWMTDEIKRELLPRFPMGRLGQPEDAARLIRFLVSPEAEWITGQVIHSEGGFMR
jgi:3-oxoacyl-[acyl-carrier protein] reductase